MVKSLKLVNETKDIAKCGFYLWYFLL